MTSKSEQLRAFAEEYWCGVCAAECICNYQCECQCHGDLLRNCADELERLEKECIKLAHLLMSGLVFVHESKITEVDKALAPYLGGSNQCIRPSR